MALFNPHAPKRILYLVRHGNFDSEARPADELGGGLTTLGRRQARLTAKRLSPLPIDTIYYSDLRRATETAAIIAEVFPNVPLRMSRLLRECTPGAPLVFPEYFQELPPEILQRDLAQAQRAYARFFRLNRRGERREVLVCHGNIIRYLLSRVMQAPPEIWGNLDVRQASVSEVELQTEWQRVNAMGDVGHLPPELWTFM
jgi:serine/threonine-protein phosphatase PGAM5